MQFEHLWGRQTAAVQSIDVKKSFHVFYSGHDFYVFLTFFILPTFFIFKNIHWKYHLLYSVDRLEFSSMTNNNCKLPVHLMHGNHHHHHQSTDLGGIMSITSVFTIGPFVPCNPLCKILNMPVMSICLVKQNDGTWVEEHKRFLFNV